MKWRNYETQILADWVAATPEFAEPAREAVQKAVREMVSPWPDDPGTFQEQREQDAVTAFLTKLDEWMVDEASLREGTIVEKLVDYAIMCADIRAIVGPWVETAQEAKV